MAKPSIDPVRWRPPPIDPLPDYAPTELTVVGVPGDAPEDVVVDADGRLYTGLVDGRILRIGADGVSAVVGNTAGRPLGLALGRDGRLLICTSPGGLVAMDVDSGAVETLVHSVGGRALQFCSNVVETSDGAIYFTESTSAFTYGDFSAAILEARGRGGLFRRDPDGTVATVLDGLYFANGVTLTADGSALVFAETQARRLSRYELTGPQAWQVTPLVENLPGYPDNLSTGSDGRIWCAIVSPANGAAEWLAPRQPLLRKVVWRLPERLQPKITPEVWAVAFDPVTGAAAGGLHTTHPDFGEVTGLVERDGRLWLACIGNPALAHCAVPARDELS